LKLLIKIFQVITDIRIKLLFRSACNWFWRWIKLILSLPESSLSFFYPYGIAIRAKKLDAHRLSQHRKCATGWSIIESFYCAITTVKVSSVGGNGTVLGTLRGLRAHYQAVRYAPPARGSRRDNLLDRTLPNLLIKGKWGEIHKKFPKIKTPSRISRANANICNKDRITENWHA